MADISYTAADVTLNAGGVKARGTAAEVITAGEPVYKDGAPYNKLRPCINTSAAATLCAGIALNAAAANQPIFYATEGEVDYGGGLSAGEVYYVSSTAGGVEPSLASSDFVTLVGAAKTASVMSLKIVALGVQVA